MRSVLELLLRNIDRVAGLLGWEVLYTILSPKQKKELSDAVNNYFYGSGDIK